MLAFFFNLSLYFYCCFRNGSVCPIFQSVVKTLERVGIIERELGACKIFLLRAKSKKKKKKFGRVGILAQHRHTKYFTQEHTGKEEITSTYSMTIGDMFKANNDNKDNRKG